jgi:GNAT superfamily N-acetyltransferase
LGDARAADLAEGERVNGQAAMQSMDAGPGQIAAVVTSLEMLARPSRRAERARLDLTLHRAARPETAWYRDLFRRVGQDWLWFSRLRMKDEELGAILADPLIEVYAVRDGSADEGLLELDFRTPGVCELGFFGLTPRLVGTGAGRWLMNRALEIVWSRQVKRFWVHTCTLDHPGALAFYIRSGFRPFRQYAEIVDDPRLDGTLPRDAAPHIPIIGEG